MRRVLLITTVVLAGMLPVVPAAASAEDGDLHTMHSGQNAEGPSPHPGIQGMGGDCGWSAELVDGKTLWVVCDPGALHVSSSAGLAPVDNAAAPVWPIWPSPIGYPDTGAALVPPDNPNMTCPSPPTDQREVAWPRGATAYPIDGGTRSRVVISFLSSCDPWMEGTTTTSGIAELIYTPGMPLPLVATPLSYDLWTSSWPTAVAGGTTPRPNSPYGDGLVHHDDGTNTHVYAYACSAGAPLFPPPEWGFTAEWGSCTVARATVGNTSPTTDDLGNPRAWSYRNASGVWMPTCGGLDAPTPTCTQLQRFQAEEQGEAPMTFGMGGSPYPLSQVPLWVSVPGHLQPRWVEDLGLFVQTSQIYVKSDVQWLRTSTSPVGPWSDPIELHPACDTPAQIEVANPNPPPPTRLVDTSGCYHSSPHPEMGDDTLPIVYYDGMPNGLAGQTHTYRVLSLDLCVEGEAGQTPFADVSSSHPFEEEIESRANACVVAGDDGAFSPGANISKQAVLVMMWRAAGFPNVRQSTLGYPRDPRVFTDIAYEFRDQARWAHQLELTTALSPSGSSLGIQTVTRGNFANLLWRLCGQPSIPVTLPNPPTFSDVGSNHNLRNRIEWAANQGVIQGYSDGTFRPTAPVTRQAAAAFLERWAPLPGNDYDPLAPTAHPCPDATP